MTSVWRKSVGGLLVVLFTAISWSGTGSTARADSAKQVFEKLAKDVKEFLKGQAKVHVDAWITDGHIKANPALGRALGFKILLERTQCYDAMSQIRVEGRISTGEGEDGSKFVTVRLELVELDKGGGTKRLAEFFEKITAHADILQIIGGSWEYNGQITDREKINQAKEKSIRENTPTKDEPKATVYPVVTGSPDAPKWKATEDGKFAIQIVVVDGGPLGPRGAIKVPDSDVLYVDLKKGEKFNIKMISNHAQETVAKITIDTVDVFTAFDPKGPSGLIVPSQSAVTMPGWYKNKDYAGLFQVTDAHEAVAVVRKAAPPSDLGVITVTFYPSWPPGKAPPGGNAIGIGDAGDVAFPTQRVQRSVSPNPISIISIRYRQ